MKNQTKAILASTMILALALSSVAGVTYSWFSDEGSSTIQVNAAQIDADVSIGVFQFNGENRETISLQKDGDQWVSAVLTITVTNNSNIPVIVKDLHPEVTREYYKVNDVYTYINPSTESSFNGVYWTFVSNNHIKMAWDSGSSEINSSGTNKKGTYVDDSGTTHTTTINVYRYQSPGPDFNLSPGESKTFTLTISAVNGYKGYAFPLSIVYNAIQANYNEMEKVIDSTETTEPSQFIADIVVGDLRGFNKIVISEIHIGNTSITFEIQNELINRIKSLTATTTVKVITTVENENTILLSMKDQSNNDVQLQGHILITIEKDGAVDDVYSLDGETKYRPLCTIEKIDTKTKLIFSIPIEHSEVHF